MHHGYTNFYYAFSTFIFLIVHRLLLHKGLFLLSDLSTTFYRRYFAKIENSCAAILLVIKILLNFC